MNNRELDQLLTKATVPQPPPSYWTEFPGDVTRIIRASSGMGTADQRSARPASGKVMGWALGAGLAAACIFIALIMNRGGTTKSHPSTASVANVQKCLSEVEAMFPNQVRAIIFEKDGPRLLLSENADVPAAAPIFLKVCDASGCESIVTFSGQRVPIKGELCDVLVDSKENVLVVGQQKFWPGGMPSQTHVEARTL